MKLKFKRGLDDARAFEVAALKCVAGFGGTFPGKDKRDGVEAQMTFEAPVAKENITVFFMLYDTYGAAHVLGMDPVIHDIYAERFYAWPSDDGTNTVAITEEVVNGRFVLTHEYNGELIRQIFEPTYNYYVPEGWGERAINDHLKKAKMKRDLVVMAG